jgi:hypothetical protein
MAGSPPVLLAHANDRQSFHGNFLCNHSQNLFHMVAPMNRPAAKTSRVKKKVPRALLKKRLKPSPEAKTFVNSVINNSFLIMYHLQFFGMLKFWKEKESRLTILTIF